jgi:hypothetical protein
VDDLLAHAILPPPSSDVRGGTEARAAQALNVELLAGAGERPLTSIWRAKTADGREVALVVVRDDVPAPERHRLMGSVDRFHKAAIPGILRVLAISPGRDAFLTDLWTTGCATDLPALGWSSRRRLEFVRTVAQAIGGLHRAGLIHGCLCSDNVLLDDDLGPVVSEAAGVSVHALNARQGESAAYEQFAAPEVVRGEAPGPRADVYSLGRLMQHLLENEGAPAVVSLLRRALAEDPAGRIATAEEVIGAIDAAIPALPEADAITQPMTTPAAAPKPAKPAAPAKDKAAGPSTKWQGSEPSEPLPVWVSPAGVGGVLLGSLVAWLLGANPFAWLLVILGAAVAGWAFPPLGEGRVRWRVLAAGACIIAVVSLDPVAFAVKLSNQRAMRDPVAAKAAFLNILKTTRSFDGMSVPGCDLSGLDMGAMNLSNVDFSHANLQRSTFSAAALLNTNFDGAMVQGSIFMGADLNIANNVETAICDDSTTFSAPWHCFAGHPHR